MFGYMKITWLSGKKEAQAAGLASTWSRTNDMMLLLNIILHIGSRS